MNSKSILYFLVAAIAAYAGYHFLGKSGETVPSTDATSPVEAVLDSTAAKNPAICLAQCTDNKVPVALCQKVVSQFPAVKCGQITIEGRYFGYEASFLIDAQTVGMEFDSTGNLIETEYEHFAETAVPTIILEAFKRDFSKSKAKEYEMEVYPDGTKAYEIEILGTSDDITYNEKGVKVENVNEVATYLVPKK